MAKLDWDRAKRDNARARRYARRHPATVGADGGRPPSERQLNYFRALRDQLGRDDAEPTTRRDAFHVIGRLRRLADTSPQT